MDLHPGGGDSILILAGQDATEDFNAIHSKKAHKMLERFLIGHVIPDLDVIKPNVVDDKDEYALNPKKKVRLGEERKMAGAKRQQKQLNAYSHN